MKRFAAIFLLCLSIWMFLSGPKFQEFVVACITSLIIANLTYKYVFSSKFEVTPYKIFSFIQFLIVWIIEEIKSCFSMSKKIITGVDEKNVGFVKVKIPFKSKFGNFLVFNGITLTPGTISVELDESKKIATIHSVDLKNAKNGYYKYVDALKGGFR